MSTEGLGRESGFRYGTRLLIFRNLSLLKASAMASGSLKYHDSNSWQTIRIRVSSLSPRRQSRRSRSFNAMQSPLSLSRSMTNLAPGSRQWRRVLEMLRSRSVLPSCGMQWKDRSGKRRGRKTSKNACIERSSRRNITRPNVTRPLRTYSASIKSRASRSSPSSANFHFDWHVLLS